MSRTLRQIARCAMVAALAASGCHETTREAPAPADAVATPVPPPDGLIAESTIVGADALWQRVQRGIAGPVGILPSTLGGLICAVSGIDPTLGGEIDGTSTAYAVVAGDVATPAWVVAMRLSDPRRALALAGGDTSRFDAHAAGDFLILDAKRGSAMSGRGLAPRSVAAISRGGGWFVVARSEDALTRLAPYAIRTMSARVPGKEAIGVDVSGAALAGPVRTQIAREWGETKAQMLASDHDQRAAHGGRAPDFGDPSAIVARIDASIQQRLAVLSDLNGAHVGIDAGDDDLRVVFTASPASPSGPASQALGAIHSGDVAPLRAVSRDAGLALLVRDSADTHAKDASDLEAALDAALGPRLPPADAKRVHAAIDDWTAARGEAWTLAWNATDRGLLIDAQASDPSRGARAVHEAVEAIAHTPALREPLRTWLGVGDVTFGAGDVPGAGRASTATFATTPASAHPYAVAWRIGPADVAVAVAQTPLPLLSPSPPGRTLGDDPAIRTLLDALGAVAGAVVLQPGRSPACDAASGGVALAWGSRDVNGSAAMWGEAIASDGALRCLAKSAF